MSDALLQTSGLTARFGPFVALDDVSVRICEGEVVGLIGTNGAGKTTFINMVTGYLRSSAGTIHLGGEDVTGLGPAQMVARGLARSFQVPQMFPEMSVREHMVLSLALAARRTERLWGRLRTSARDEQAERSLARLGLESIADRTVASIPQGQRKLVDIAMAMTLRPRLLFLDEPTSGVSSDEKLHLMDTVFEAVRADGVTVLFVEHDMEVVTRYVTRLMAFRDGRMLADGSPEEVMRHHEVASSVLRRRELAA